MTTDADFTRDVLYFGAFAVVALLGEIAWHRFAGAHPPDEQRPGDVGQLARTTCGCVVVGGGGLVAAIAVFLAWLYAIGAAGH